MKKLFYLLLLVYSGIFAQVSSGMEQEFDYGIKNNSSQQILTPDTLVTKGVDGTYGHTSAYRLPVSTATQAAIDVKVASNAGLQNAYNFEPEIVTSAIKGAVTLKRGSAADTDNVLVVQNGAGSVTGGFTGAGILTASNKQNSLATDGTGVKFPTVDAVNDVISFVTPQQYGAIGDGIADDTAAIQAALNANSNVLLYGIYKISSQLEINHGQYIFGNNATIVPSSSTIKILNVNAKFYWKIDGNIILQGTGKANNTAVGLNIIGGSNYSVDGISMSGISGYGIKLTQGASMGDRGERGRFSNISIQDSWTGVEIGTSYEYVSFNQLNASGNGFAMTILSGNVNVDNSNLNDNDNGLYVGGVLGTNNSHGIISNTNINHNTNYNVFCENVEFGETFTGCHIYGEVGASIDIIDSNGVLFNGCIIDGTLNNADAQVTKGAIILSSCQLDPSYSLVGDAVYYKNCFSKTDDQLTSAIFDNGTNVGIGTKTPTNYAGYTTLAVNGTSGSVFEMDHNNTGAYSVIVDNARTTISESRGLPLEFTVNTFTVMKLNPTGSAELLNAPTAPTATAGTNTTQIATTAFVQNVARPYKVYTALLYQTGTNAPVATVLENTLGGTVVWTRDSAGVYDATLTGAFPANKTAIFLNSFNSRVGASSQVNYVRLGVDGGDGVLAQNNAMIEIRVYN